MPLISPKKPIQIVSIEVRYVENENGEITILKDDEKTEGVVFQTARFVFRPPNWGDTKSIMSACSQIGQEGRLTFDGYKFIDMRLKRLLVDWSLTDEKEKRLPVTEENIEQLPASVVSYLNEKLEKVPCIASAFGADVK
jgi:hypothetical protein